MVEKHIDDKRLQNVIAMARKIKWKDGSWHEKLVQHLRFFQNFDVEKITEIENFKELFESQAVCATGNAKSTPIKKALNSEDLRTWFAEKVCDQRLTANATTSMYVDLYDDCLEKIEPYCINKNGDTSKPKLKLSRALCALYPEQFSAIGNHATLKTLHKQLIGGKSQHPVVMHHEIADKLNRLLGLVKKNDAAALADRMILQMQIFAYLNPDSAEGQSSHADALVQVENLSAEEFAKALLLVKKEFTDEQWKMLIGHASAQGRALSITSIEKFGGHDILGAGALLYERLAGVLGEELGVRGLEQKMNLIAIPHSDSDEVGQLQWEMRPQLVEALWESAEDKMLACSQNVVDVEREFANDPKMANVTATERSALVQARIGQGRYRKNLIDYWQGRCSITGCSVETVLIASHIKPWKESGNSERLDPFNGLLLVATLDKLFDNGMISFSDDGKLLYVPELTAYLDQLSIKPTTRLRKVEDRHKKYLKFHREKFGFTC